MTRSPRSPRSIVAIACCLFTWTLCASASAGDTPANEPQQPAIDKELALQLDYVIQKAEKKAGPYLKEQVTSAQQALHLAPAKYRERYRVLDYKGWWIVAWYGAPEETRPTLWVHGFAIRKNSKDYYRFEGTW